MTYCGQHGPFTKVVFASPASFEYSRDGRLLTCEGSRPHQLSVVCAIFAISLCGSSSDFLAPGRTNYCPCLLTYFVVPDKEDVAARLVACRGVAFFTAQADVREGSLRNCSASSGKVPARFFDAWDVGLRTTGGSGSSESLRTPVEVLESSYDEILKAFAPLTLSYTFTPVVTGFIGKSC